MDLRLSTSAADLLIIRAEAAHMTKTAFVEAAIRAFSPHFSTVPPPEAGEIAPEVFEHHAQQLVRRRKRR